MEIYLIIKESGEYETLNSEPIGYLTSYDEASDYVSYLQGQCDKSNELDKYRSHSIYNNDINYRFTPLEQLKMPSNTYIQKCNKEHEEKLKKVILEKNKEIEALNIEQQKNKEQRIETLKELIYNIIETNNIKDNKNEIREYLYLTSDPKVVKWAYENKIKY